MQNNPFQRSYPLNYRREAVEIIAQWTYEGNSGTIISLPGAGKSNLFQFLCRYPQALQQYLPTNAPLTVAIYVDCNSLPDYEVATLYRTLLRSIHEAEPLLSQIEPSLPHIVRQHYEDVITSQDPFVCQSALRRLLSYFREIPLRTIFILDPFDKLCLNVPVLALDNLRGLRDSFKNQVCYLIGLPQRLQYLRTQTDVGAMLEIIDGNRYWLGVMNQEDAFTAVSHFEHASNLVFPLKHKERLISLTGGYPSLLRAACQWLANCVPLPKPTKWGSLLIAQPSIQNRLRAIWGRLTSEEQELLFTLVRRVMNKRSTAKSTLSTHDEQVVAGLVEKQFIIDRKGQWVFFCILFQEFVVSKSSESVGRIWHNQEEKRCYRGQLPLDTLTTMEKNLLQYFINNMGLRTIDDLRQAVWAETENEVTPWAVQQTISQLRRKIELDPANPSYLITRRGQGYEFFPEGKPTG